MEFGSFEENRTESTPENKGDYFEMLEKESLKKTDEEREKQEKTKKAEQDDKKRKEKTPAETKEASSSPGSKKSKETTKNELPNSEREAIKQELAKEYVAARKSELAEQIETLQPTDPEYQVAVADLALMEELDQKLDDPNLEVDPAVEAAYEQIMEDLESVVPPVEGLETEDETSTEALTEDDLNDPIPANSPTITSSSPPPVPVPALPSTPTPIPTATPPPHAAASPSVPLSTATSVTPSRSAPPVASPEAPAPGIAKPERRTRTAQRLVASGAIGAFFLGRKSAEKSWLGKSIQPEGIAPPNRSEAAVNPERQIERAEHRVRKFALEQAITAPPERPITRPEASIRSREVQPPIKREAFKLQPISVESSPSTAAPSERVFSDIRPHPREAAPAPPINREASSAPVRLEQLSTPDLLQVAHNIKIDGTTVRQLFESNRIDYKGLTSIVREALKGGNIKKAFQKHELGEEAVRGRAIEMRHDDPAKIPSGTSGHSANSLVSSLIEQLQVVNSNSENATNTQPQHDVTHHEAVLASKQKAAAVLRKKNIVTLSVATVTAIGIGAALALFLLG